MFVRQHAPHDRHVLNDEIEGNRTDRSDDADHRLYETEAVRERLHHSEYVHVDADAFEEGARQVDNARTRQRKEISEDDV